MSRTTDRTTEPGPADFLGWGHQRLSFLAPRAFCESGVYCPGGTPDHTGFLEGPGLEYGGQTGPVFDLDAGLEAWFGQGWGGDFPQALVVRTEALSPRTQELLGRTLGPSPILGFRIRTETHMVRLRPDEVRWFGTGATAALVDRGLLGCRFPAPDRITYLIDPEALLRRALQRLEEERRAPAPRG